MTLRLPPARRAFAVALLCWALAALAWAVAVRPGREAEARAATGDPFRWRRDSSPVRALERLLAAHGARIERGATVLVVARAPNGSAAGHVWHWAQYLAPHVNFHEAEDVGLDAPAEHALLWGVARPRPGWRRWASEGDFALYEVQP